MDMDCSIQLFQKCLNFLPESLFSTVIKQQADFAEAAQWYLALNYLKKEEYEKTIQVLEKLKGAESSFGQKAKELLKEIE